MDFDESNNQINEMINYLDSEVEHLESINDGLWIAHGALCTIHGLDKFQAYNGEWDLLPSEIRAILEKMRVVEARQRGLKEALQGLREVDMSAKLH